MLANQRQYMNVGYVKRARFVYSGTYNDVALRPYNPVVDGSTEMSLINATDNYTNITKDTISPIASDILGYTTNPIGMSSISNGYDTRRYSFSIWFVVENSSVGPKSHVVLTGYTDHPGASKLGSEIKVDMNMRLYFNNIYYLREAHKTTPYGVETTMHLVQSSQILTRANGSGYMVEPMYSLTPKSVFTNISAANNPKLNNLDATVTTTLLNMEVCNNRSKIPSCYLSDMFNVMRNVNTEAQADESLGMFGNQDVFSSARSQIAQLHDSTIPVIWYSILNSGYSHDGFITYGKLCSIYPEMWNNSIVPDPTTSVRGGSVRGSSEYWTGGDNTTIAANVILQRLPALMNDLLLGVFSFSAHNSSGEHIVVPTAALSNFEGLDVTPHVNVLCERIKTEILMTISHRNMLPYTLHVSANLVGDLSISISLDSGPQIEYSAPLFCDHRFTSLYTTDSNQYTSAREGFEIILNAIPGSTGGLMYNGNDNSLSFNGINPNAQAAPGQMQQPINPMNPFAGNMTAGQPQQPGQMQPISPMNPFAGNMSAGQPQQPAQAQQPNSEYVNPLTGS